MKFEEAQAMSNDELNTKVALFCGYIRHSMQEITDRLRVKGAIIPNISTDSYWTNPAGQIVSVPRYCSDLNSMHEAEKTLTEKQFNMYIDALWNACGGASGKTGAIIASARQRAEAFVITMGEK